MSRAVSSNSRPARRSSKQSDDESFTGPRCDFEGLELIAWRKRIILPHWWSRRAWDWMLITLVLYNLVYLPLEICFVFITAPWLKAFNILVDVLFIFDLALNFRTAYYEGVGLTPVIEFREIARNYVFGQRKVLGSSGVGWFWPDFIAAIPFDWVPVGTLESATFLSFAKIGRIFRLGRLIKKLDQFTAARAVRVTNFLLLVLLCTHTFGCIWWKVGYDTYNDRGWQFEFKVAEVLLEANPHGIPDPYLHPGELINTTRLRELYDHEVTMEKKYITAMYWALTMVMKSPWLYPHTGGQQIYACFAVVVGAMLFAAFIGNFTTAIASFDKSNAMYRDSIGTLRTFFRMKPQFKASTRKQTFRYYEAYFKQTNEGVPDQAVLATIPEHLRSSLLLELHADLISACPWLQDVSFACCCDFLMLLRTEVLLRGDALLKAGVAGRHFYILMTGELQVLFPPEGGRMSKLSALLGEGQTTITKGKENQKTSSRVPQGRIERQGSLIGWLPPYGMVRPLVYTVIAGRDSTLLSITRAEMATLLEDHPIDAIWFKRASDYAARVINPLKKTEGGVVDHLTGDRRCSTKEFMSNGSRPLQMTRGSSSAEDDLAMKTAADAGWLHSSRKSASARAMGEEATCRTGSEGDSSSSNASDSSTDDKISALLEEVIALRQNFAESHAEIASLRRILERDVVGVGDADSTSNSNGLNCILHDELNLYTRVLSLAPALLTPAGAFRC